MGAERNESMFTVGHVSDAKLTKALIRYLDLEYASCRYEIMEMGDSRTTIVGYFVPPSIFSISEICKAAKSFGKGYEAGKV